MPARCPFSWYTDVSILGNTIAVRGRTPTGDPLYWKTTYQPSLAIPCAGPSNWKTLDGRNAQLVSFPSIRDMYVWDETQTGNGVEVFGNISPIYQCIGSSFAYPIPYDLNALKTDYFDIEVEAEDKFPSPEHAAYPVNVISYYSRGVMNVWGTKPDYKPDRTDIQINYVYCKSEHDLLQNFIEFYSRDYPDVISGWNTGGFDIPYLYNRICKIFDADSANLLSPYKQMRQRVATIFGKEKRFLDIVGVAHLDYLEIYKKFTYTQQESYRLDYIAHVELKERKLAYAEYASLHELAKKDWQKFVAYNVQDTYLVVRLEEKLKFIQLIATLAYTARTNFLDTFKQVRMWDAMMYYALTAQNIVIPPKPIRDKVDQYAGAYVKDPKPGAYSWVLSFDVNSLYPSLMRQFNISPDRHVPREDLEMRFKQNGADADDLQTVLTMLDQINPDAYLTTPDVLQKATPALERLGLTATPNKQCFRTDIGDGVLPTLLAEAYDARVSAKKKQLAAEQELSKETDPDKKRELGFTVTRWKNEQTSRKVQLNSAYGSVGNQHFRYYDVRQAEAVTLSGQMVIRAVEQHLNRWLNGVMKTTDVDYVIASDTDSVYLHLGPMVESKFPQGMTDDQITSKLDAFAQKFIEPQINQVFDTIAKDTHAHKSLMVMKRESIGRRAVWQGKKHYIIDVLDSEGVRFKEPKLKMMGIEAVKSSTPTACRNYIKKAMEIFMRGKPEQLHEFVKNCWEEFKTLPYEDIAFPRGLNGLEKYAMDGDRYAPKTPIHVRGALVYNGLIVDQQLDRKYSALHDGDKVKFCYLRTPNIAKSDIIAAPGGLPTEWAQTIGALLDYDKQFEKGFLSPLKAIVECAGWTTEPVNDLDSLFV